MRDTIIQNVRFLKPVTKSSMPNLMSEYDAILVLLKNVIGGKKFWYFSIYCLLIGVILFYGL